jgi:hypothetical protein
MKMTNLKSIKMACILFILSLSIFMSGCMVNKNVYPVLSNRKIAQDDISSYQIRNMSKPIDSRMLSFRFFWKVKPITNDILPKLDQIPGAIGFVDAEHTFRNLQIIPFILNINTSRIKTDKVLINQNLQ